MAKANGKKNYNKLDVFFRRSSWYINYPVFNDDGSTGRKWKGGHATEIEARAAYDIKYTEYLSEKIYLLGEY